MTVWGEIVVTTWLLLLIGGSGLAIGLGLLIRVLRYCRESRVYRTVDGRAQIREGHGPWEDLEEHLRNNHEGKG